VKVRQGVAIEQVGLSIPVGATNVRCAASACAAIMSSASIIVRRVQTFM
jgi:LSD1 subclass zinc finger protein